MTDAHVAGPRPSERASGLTFSPRGPTDRSHHHQITVVAMAHVEKKGIWQRSYRVALQHQS